MLCQHRFLLLLYHSQSAFLEGLLKIGHGTIPCLIRNLGDVLLLLSRLLSNVMMTVTDGRNGGDGDAEN